MTRAIAQAIRDVLHKLEPGGFMLPAVVVQFEDNQEMTCVPEAHLSDISWVERHRGRTVVLTVGENEIADIRAAEADGQLEDLIECWLE